MRTTERSSRWLAAVDVVGIRIFACYRVGLVRLVTLESVRGVAD